MLNFRVLLAVSICLCVWQASVMEGHAQTQIFSENFDVCKGAYSEYGVHSDGASDYFLRTNGSNETINCVAPTIADNGFTTTSDLLSFTNTNGFYYTGEDTDRTENPNQSGGAFGSGANSAGVHFNDIDVSSFTNVQIKCSFAARNDSPTVGTFEFGDGVKIYVDKTNNGTYELLAAFAIVETPELFGNQYLSLDTDFDGYGEGAILSSAFQEFTFDVSGASTMDVRIELVSTGSNEEVAFDTFIVQGDPASSAPTSVTVAATAFLEGAYNGTDLNKSINSQIPLTQPYSNNGHSGGTAMSIPANAVDWVLVELREAASAAAALSSTKVGSTAGFLMNDGTIKATDGTSNLTVSLTDNTGADFFIVIYHRNHLPIMSASAISESGSVYTIDFTSLAASTHKGVTGLASLAGSKFGMLAGDADGDGDVDGTDLSTWQSQNGNQFSYNSTNGDFNLDGVINAVDRNEYQQMNSGRTNQVPSN